MEQQVTDYVRIAPENPDIESIRPELHVFSVAAILTSAFCPAAEGA